MARAEAALNLPLPNIHREADNQYLHGCLMVVESGHPDRIDIHPR